MKGNNGSSLIGGGIFLLICGVIAYIYGQNLDSDFSRKANTFFESGKTYKTGQIIWTIGIIVVIIGLILLIAGIVMYLRAQNKDAEFPYINNTPSPEDVTFKFGTYYSDKKSDIEYILDLIPNGNCYWHQNGDIYSGIYRKCAPQQWEIILENYGKSFIFYVEHQGIHIKGGSVDVMMYTDND